jgi:lipid-binding SYLF domain-containing protein
MKMFSAGVGLGIGIKDFRGIFVFDNQSAFNQFINQGWEANGQADAAGKLGEKGDSAEAAVEPLHQASG